MSVEFWKSIFDWAAVVLVGFTFIAGAGALITGKILTDRQDEKVRKFSIDLTAAQTELGKQQERAAKAEGQIASADAASKEAVAKVALAEARVAEASAKAESFRLDIAQANQQAAEANRIAEQERLARIRLEASLADRVLTSDGQTQLGSLAKEFANGIHLDVCAFGGTLEVANIAQGIIRSLNGWTIRLWQVTGGAAARGILIGTSPSATDIDREAAQRLIVALNSAGIGAENWRYDDLVKAANSGMRNGPAGVVDAPILMVIGTKR